MSQNETLVNGSVPLSYWTDPEVVKRVKAFLTVQRGLVTSDVLATGVGLTAGEADSVWAKSPSLEAHLFFPPAYPGVVLWGHPALLAPLKEKHPPQPAPSPFPPYEVRTVPAQDVVVRVDMEGVLNTFSQYVQQLTSRAAVLERDMRAARATQFALPLTQQQSQNMLEHHRPIPTPGPRHPGRGSRVH